MKKIALLSSLALLAGSLMAQPGIGFGSMGNGPAAGVDWKIGTVVTTEYKKVTGQLVIGTRLEPVLKVDGVEYLLVVPGRTNVLVNAKNGETISIEGTVTTIKGDTALPAIHAFKVTIAGKETDLSTLDDTWGGRGGMMGRDDNRNGYNQGGFGPRR